MPDLQTELDELFDRFEDGSHLELITSAVHKQLEGWGISDQEIRVVSPLPSLVPSLRIQRHRPGASRSTHQST